jgi:hypothetical protein
MCWELYANLLLISVLLLKKVSLIGTTRSITLRDTQIKKPTTHPEVAGETSFITAKSSKQNSSKGMIGEVGKT